MGRERAPHSLAEDPERVVDPARPGGTRRRARPRRTRERDIVSSFGGQADRPRSRARDGGVGVALAESNEPAGRRGEGTTVVVVQLFADAGIPDRRRRGASSNSPSCDRAHRLLLSLVTEVHSKRKWSRPAAGSAALPPSAPRRPSGTRPCTKTDDSQEPICCSAGVTILVSAATRCWRARSVRGPGGSRPLPRVLIRLEEQHLREAAGIGDRLGQAPGLGAALH